MRRHAIVKGRVQGVGFRWSAAERARSLGLTGWVRNLADRSVEIEFQGQIGDVAEMEAWLHRGPFGARVLSVDVCEVPIIDDEEDLCILH